IVSPELLVQWSGPTFTYPLTEEQLTTYIATANSESASTYIFKVLVDDQVIGHISLGYVNQNDRSARICRVLLGNPSTRGNGIGQQMMNAILTFAFDELKLHRVSLGVYDFNVGAIKCYESVGFQKEGLLREVSKVGDVYWSSFEMGILEGEWGR
ncbi:MAG: GNAT family N-acetyltransferase, partial [Bacilli bacterium]